MGMTITKSQDFDFGSLPDKIGRIAALNSVALVSGRVQNRGQNSDGNSIGQYSPSYASKRLKHKPSALQVDIIDLTYSGEMMDSFTFSPRGKDYVVGFSSTESGQKSDWNEERFGELFQLSNEELNLVNTEIQKGLDEYFK